MASLNVLVVAGSAQQLPQYARDGKIITATLKAAGMNATQVDDGKAVKSLAGGAYSAVVVYTHGDYFDDAGIESLVNFVRHGGGVVGVHTAIATNPASEIWGKLFGARIKSGFIGEHKIAVSDPEHPIAHRIQDFRMDDELYATEQKSDFRPFLSTWWGDKPQPMGWTRSEGKGIVAYLGNGHTPGGLSHPTFKQLLVRSVRFSTGEDWSNKTVKCGMVGYGAQFQMAKLHLQSAEKARLKAVAVCDIDPPRLVAAKADFNDRIQVYPNLDQMLKESDAELIGIITPHDQHADQAVKIIESGRHAVSEKPFTVSIEQATKVIETARRVKKMATVFHNRRWDGNFLTIQRLVQSGVIGDVFHIDVSFGGFHEPKEWWRSDKTISGGSFFDWGAHFTDWVLQLMPHKIESVSGDFKKLKWHAISNEDYTSAYVRFEGGRSASIEQGSINAIEKTRYRILGTQGGIEQTQGDTDSLRLVTFKDGKKIESRVPFDKGDWDAYYRNIADHLILGEPLAVTPESARDVIAVMYLAEQSSQQGGKPLPLPYQN